jgi:excisionase family DNA binding protein
VAEQLLTVNEVAAQLRIKPETVRRWLRAGKIRGALPGGDKMGYRIAEGEVTRLLNTAGARASRA